MSTEKKASVSLVGITGESNDRLYVLANMYHEPFDSESVLTVVVKLAHKPDFKGDVIYSTETWCTAMDQSPSGNLFVVSMEGELHKYQEGRWNILKLDCPRGLNSVWAASDTKVFAVGVAGERVRIFDNQIEVIRDSKNRRLNCVHGSGPNNAYAVGDDGLVYRFDGNGWEELEPPTDKNLLSVFCRSNKEVYVGGVEGVLLRWNGIRWDKIRCARVTISSLALYNSNLFAAAGRGGVHILREGGLEEFKVVTIYRLRTVNNLLFGIGNAFAAQFDGNGWWGGEIAL